MDMSMKALEHERRDWVIILLILLFGLLFMLLAGGWALRFTSHWELDANMESKLDPNSDFLTRRPSGFIEPVDPAMLTSPAWINVFLTPGASFATGESFTTPIITGAIATTQTTTPTTIASPTNTVAVTSTPTNAIAFFPPASTSTPMPQPADTSTAISASTSVSISTTTPTSSPTSIPTSTAILNSTLTFTPIPTFTNTPDPSEPDFGGPDGNTIILGNG